MQPEIQLTKHRIEPFDVILALLEMLLRQPFHEILEHKVGVALAHSSEILAVLVGEAVQDQGCEFVHPLRVVIFRVVLQVNEDYAGQPIFVGQFLALLSSE